MGCITHVSNNSKRLWNYSLSSKIKSTPIWHSHQHLHMYHNAHHLNVYHKWKNGRGGGVILETDFDYLSVEVIRVGIWNLNIHKFLNLNTFHSKYEDVIWFGKTHTCIWAYNHFRSMKYGLECYTSQAHSTCIYCLSKYIFPFNGGGGLSVASVD